MNLIVNKIVLCTTLLSCMAWPSLAVVPAHVSTPDFLVTSAPLYRPLAELRGGERFPEGAQLLLVHEGRATQLIPDFADSADADLSYDGKSILFAGKRLPGDRWQIWELKLKDHSVRRVVSTATDAERPLYLPGGRLVWAQRFNAGFELNSTDLGPGQQPIPRNPTADPGPLLLTHLQASAFPETVLQDGRILFESGYPLGVGSTPEMYLVYADGSGVESVRCDHGRARWGGRQLQSGDTVFTHGNSLARFTSAQANEVPVRAPSGAYAGSVVEISPNQWMVSVKRDGQLRYAIDVWRPGDSAMQAIIAEQGKDLVEPLLLVPHVRPNRHPSGLHPWDYANLLAFDSRLSRSGDLKATPAAVRLEMQDLGGKTVTMGTAPVAKDGSFFVKVPGDRPLRFVLLDSKGRILRREHGWFWARGGEQRICVGCHTGPERSTENRVPEVLLRSTTPVDLTVPVKSAALHRSVQEAN